MSFKITKIPEGKEQEIFDFYKAQLDLGETFRDIADAYNQFHQVNHSEASLRRRYIKMRDAIYEKEDEAEEEAQRPPSNLEIRADGSQRLMAYNELTIEQSKSPEYIMQVNGYDPTLWAINKLVIGEWTMGNSTNPGSYHYKISLDIKPKDLSVLTRESLLEANTEYTYVHAPIQRETRHAKDNSGRALEVGLPDLHIGSAQSNAESIKEKIEAVAKYATETNVDKIYLTFLGDILNIDNTNETTIKGTQLKNEGTAYEMYIKARELTDFIVYSFSKFEVHVISVIGNHAGLIELALFDALKGSWRNNPHITFDVGPELRKAYLYGNTLVGLTHGNMPKKNLFGWLASDFAELWGKSTSREMHYGHFHSEDVVFDAGVTNRRLPTTKGTDEFENAMGYIGDRNMIQTFIYDEQTGLEQINYW